RVVQQDWTIRWRNRWFQITAQNQKLGVVKRKVRVCEQLDGTVVIVLGKRELAWEELPERPAGVRPVPVPARASGGRQKPSATHPWRRAYQASPSAPAAPSTARRISG